MKRILIAGAVPALLLGIAAGSASADGASLPPLATELPARCKPLAHVPASATIAGPALSARVSVANCTAEVALNELTPVPDAAFVERANTAVASSVAMLDDVIASGDPYWMLIAQDAKRDLYTGLIVRDRRSIASDDPKARLALEPLLAPWQADAGRAELAMRDLARSHPELATRDAVVAGVFRQAEHGAKVSTIP